VYVCRVVISVALLLMMIVAPTAQAQQLQSVLSPGIIINLPSRTLTLYSGETMVKEYPIAIGKPSTPTPLGSFAIIQKEMNPVWIPPGKGYVVPSGPDNPLGYRWMGFLPLYGVHGTNAPWAIGLAVSNGCVRMLEEDAEELYEVVRYGTPLRITYERVKVRVDESGQASIGIYPDVYGYRQVSLADVKNKLAEYGLAGMVSENFLIKQIQDEPDKQVVFAKFFTLKVNDKVLNERGVMIDDVLYVPIWPIATAKKSNIVCPWYHYG
jgi:L,D-transpeptidase ErfK/SrfK